jgi:hypothetical protein
MIAAGELIGRTTVREKRGNLRSLHHRSAETKIAGLTYYVAVLWPDTPS